MTMLIAGHETMANTMAWLFWELSRRGSDQDELAGVVNSVLAGRTAQADDILALAPVTSAFQEALRLYPPAWILGREARENISLGSEKIQKDEMILMPVWHVHRLPEYWQRPNEFIAERFNRNGPAGLRSDTLCTYLPFSHGARACIGQSLALRQSTLIAASLLQRLKFSEGKQNVKPKFQLLMRPPEHMSVVCTRIN